jgi:hypothetical protein
MQLHTIVPSDRDCAVTSDAAIPPAAETRVHPEQEAEYVRPTVSGVGEGMGRGTPVRGGRLVAQSLSRAVPAGAERGR